MRITTFCSVEISTATFFFYADLQIIFCALVQNHWVSIIFHCEDIGTNIGLNKSEENLYIQRKQNIMWRFQHYSKKSNPQVLESSETGLVERGE